MARLGARDVAAYPRLQRRHRRVPRHAVHRRARARPPHRGGDRARSELGPSLRAAHAHLRHLLARRAARPASAAAARSIRRATAAPRPCSRSRRVSRATQLTEIAATQDRAFTAAPDDVLLGWSLAQVLAQLRRHQEFLAVIRSMHHTRPDLQFGTDLEESLRVTGLGGEIPALQAAWLRDAPANEAGVGRAAHGRARRRPLAVGRRARARHPAPVRPLAAAPLDAARGARASRGAGRGLVGGQRALARHAPRARARLVRPRSDRDAARPLLGGARGLALGGARGAAVRLARAARAEPRGAGRARCSCSATTPISPTSSAARRRVSRPPATTRS